MRRRVGIAVAAIAIALLGATLAHGDVRQLGTLRVFFDGSFAPHSLPRDRSVPVTVSVEGRISTTDGTHPPSLRRLKLELNRAGRLSTVGLPTCTAPQLQSTTHVGALAQCQPALVGNGRFAADLTAEGNPVPTSGRILVFNARSQGKPALLLHLYGTTPVQATFVLPLEIQQRARGQFGTVLATRVPKLAGGIGSITEISLEIGREYTYRGQRRAYVSASCAAPEGFSVGIFPFLRGNFRFADGKVLETSLTGDCRVRR
ncbi:MAG: hypothetical protein JJE35_08810 [Thermoleophilia bacterium]|nr:hypothetical protein [Thermoleophilia bacterium]